MVTSETNHPGLPTFIQQFSLTEAGKTENSCRMLLRNLNEKHLLGPLIRKHNNIKLDLEKYIINT
jgi:hypothetical protein